MKKLTLLLFAIIFLSAGCLGEPRSGETTKVYDRAKQQLGVANEASYEGRDGRNALDLLREYYNNVETKQFSFGQMVVAIDGKQAEDGKNFWSFYVNGQQAAVSADTYVTKNGERIQWKLEEINQ